MLGHKTKEYPEGAKGKSRAKDPSQTATEEKDCDEMAITGRLQMGKGKKMKISKDSRLLWMRKIGDCRNCFTREMESLLG